MTPICKTTFAFCLVLYFCVASTLPSAEAVDALELVQLESFQVNGFWKQQFGRLTEKWIPHCIREMEAGGKGQELTNLVNAAKIINGQPHEEYTGLPWSDAYVYNTMEAICLALTIDPAGDEKLAKAQLYLRDKMEEWIPIILGAQLESGYIHTFHTVNGRPHFTQIGDHEFYVMGYFIEMAVAHSRLTDGQDRRLYNAAIRLADHLDETFGPAPKRTWKNGHAGLEYALCRLARLANEVEGQGKGDKYYLLAKHFLDHQYETEPNPYDQSERPAISMEEATGHAVRATYFYTGMADMALLTRDENYLAAVDRLWDNAINRKEYITGGVGASHQGEAFSKDYDLRNDGYCESCAGCGMAFWADRMFRIHHFANYQDVFERLLYNNVLGALELSGENFFYQNPLSSDKARYPWHACPCCVGNIPRTMFMLKDMMYVTNSKHDDLYVNQYVDCSATIPDLAGAPLTIRQETGYPWHGTVKLTFNLKKSAVFTLKLRIPDRTESDLYTATPDLTGAFEVHLNEQRQMPEPKHGYVEIKREWRKGDVVELSLPMEVQRVHCDTQVEADRGRVAFIRGPLVYNFESVDHDVDVRELAIGPDAKLKAVWKGDLLSGVMILKGTASQEGVADETAQVMGVPNYARLNRGGYSQVWMKEYK